LIKRSAIAKGTAVAALAVLILVGAVGIFYYTSAPAQTSTTSINTSSTSSTATTSASSTGNSSTPGPASGYQNAQGLPEGAWAQYLGYVPSGYVLAPHYANAAQYPCPSGMNPTQCKLFQASCGNGVCDPNESCATCPIDCGIQGQLTCDPYTGRSGAPISVCQLGGLG
jgi:hypothetical protein